MGVRQKAFKSPHPHFSIPAGFTQKQGNEDRARYVGNVFLVYEIVDVSGFFSWASSGLACRLLSLLPARLCFPELTARKRAWVVRLQLLLVNLMVSAHYVASLWPPRILGHLEFSAVIGKLCRVER